MDPKEIRNQYTRKEMNDIAEILGVESPDEYPNKATLADVIKEKWSDRKGDVSRDIKEAKTVLKSYRDSEVDISPFKEEFKKLMNAHKDNQLLTMFDLIDDVKQQGNAIIELDQLIKGTKENMSNVPDDEKRNEFKKSLKSIISRCKKGGYSDVLEECKKLNDDIESHMQEHKEIEKDLLENLDKAKERLANLRETKIEIGHVKDLVRDSVDLHKKGDFKKSFEKVKESLEQSESILNVYEKIEEGKDKIQRLKEKGNEIESYIETLKRGKKKADEKDYQYAMQLLDDVLMEMETDLKEDIKEAKQSVDDISLKVKNIYRKIIAIEKALQYIKKDLEDLNK